MHQVEKALSPKAGLPVGPFVGVIRPACVAALLFMVVTGLLYPLATTAVANLLFPAQAQGSLMVAESRVVGSRHIGQAFNKPSYFHGRPSATMGADPLKPGDSIALPYNGAASGASNQGAGSRQLLDDVAQRSELYRLQNGLPPDAPVPVDAVTASASGLDPHISLANAHGQAGRVARSRGVDVEKIEQLITQHTSPRQLGLLGEARINVLELNLALDRVVAAARTTP